jgi:ATP-dependent DNA helicase PIF1
MNTFTLFDPCFSSTMELNADQTAAFEAVKSGSNLFLTGPAGSGKSYLIRQIVEWAESTAKTVGLTALTGCAALLLGNKAKTLHSWGGIGLGRDAVDALVASINRYPATKRRWRRTDILIVDEVSMMTPALLELLDAVGRKARKCPEKPFGGIQLVFVGDFYPSYFKVNPPFLYF